VHLRLCSALSVGLASLLVLAGCASSHSAARSGDRAGAVHQGQSQGAELFHSVGCAGCHTLAAADSHGIVGPNLDALNPTFATVVRQVTNGGNGMPSFRGRLKPSAVRAIAQFVATASDPSAGATALAFVPDATTLGGCGQADFQCVRQAFGNIAYHLGPREALAQLQTASRTNTMIDTYCHQITHEIGHAAYTLYKGNTATALSQGAMTCGSGYYHGVVERAFSGLARSQVAKAAQTLCAALARSPTFIRYQCVHGLGHGLMIYSGDDLPYSLGICDKLATNWSRQSCTGGVFMQNFLTGAGAMMRSSWLRQRDLIYPCDVVAPRDKLYCYLQITARILPAVGYKWSAAAAWCGKSEPGWVDTCFESLGRDASGFADRRSAGILKICRVSGSEFAECIYGAARDVADSDGNGRRAAAMCDAAPGSVRGRCFEGVGSIVGTLQAAPSARVTTCRALAPARLRPACDRGAGV
jgi:mono/diheme cytochrome c family protein